MACVAPLPILGDDGCTTSDSFESTSLRYSEVYDEVCQNAALPQACGGSLRRNGSIASLSPYHHHLPEEHLTLSTEFVKDLNASPGLTLRWTREGDLFTMRGLAGCLGYSLNISSNWLLNPCAPDAPRTQQPTSWVKSHP